MNFSSSLTDDKLPLVIDTSVLINLHGSSYGAQVLSSIPNQIIVPKIVAAEFDKGSSDKDFLPKLTSNNIVNVIELTDDEYDLYGKLILSLDDGESATIAIAITRNSLPIVDERKGRAQAISLAPSLEPGWSLDLLRHPQVISKLGSPHDVDALFQALYISHMRIPEDRVEEIIALIGAERAKECNCLPGYKRRFGNG